MNGERAVGRRSKRTNADKKDTMLRVRAMSLALVVVLMIVGIAKTPYARQDKAGVVAGITGSVNSVNADNLRSTVLHLENYGNRSTWEKQWETARWAAAELEKYGLDATLQTYEHDKKQWPNVIATRRGTKHAEEIIMPIAHLDSISDAPHREGPGADDDGSGVAAVLEIARILQLVPVERTVMFCLFSNEERGAHGSKYFARHAKEQKLDIRAVINLDVLGYNAPKAFAPFDAIRAHYTVKHKIKAFYRMSRNFMLSVFSNQDRVKIAGREENALLVKMVSQRFQQYADIGVKEITGGGCA